MPTRTRRAVAGLALVLVSTGLLAGCGKDDDPSATPSMGSTATATAPGDVRTTTSPSKSAQPVPSGGPTGIGTFPVPPGVSVKGPGALERSWQFDIFTKDTDQVLAFYRKALPAAGYTVRNDVTKMLGAEEVTYDIEFSGKAEGYIVVIPGEDDVYVTVQSPPEDPAG